MTLHRFTAIPLTPIHIGDGSFLSPETWRLAGHTMERFAPPAVLRAMTAQQRKAYLDALDEGRLHDAQRLLRERVRPEHVIDRTAVGAAALSELREVVENPMRKGEVRPFVRTAGRPFIPGSTIKGAIRTALVSARAQSFLPKIEAVKNECRTGNGAIHGTASDRVQRVVLDYESTDQDPLRFVRCADAALPDGATRIERVVNWRPARRAGEADAEKMQMIFETLRARGDGSSELRFDVEITVAGAALEAARERDGGRDRVPRLRLDPDAVSSAVNAFHWAVFDAEREKFYQDQPAILDLLRQTFKVALRDGERDAQALRGDGRFLLLRVGRFGQFESKSIETAREGWNAQGKPPKPMRQGNTRNVIRVGSGRVPLPMGWLLLCPPDALADRQPAVAVARRATATPPAPRPPARLQRASLGGEPVEIVQRKGAEVLVRFASGDTEWIDQSELDGQPT